jgi:hypothetical protein
VLGRETAVELFERALGSDAGFALLERRIEAEASI